MGSKILRAQSALMLLMNSRKIAKRNLKCVEVYLELHIFFMLAREFESVETSPGLASPYLVSFFFETGAMQVPTKLRTPTICG